MDLSHGVLSASQTQTLNTKKILHAGFPRASILYYCFWVRFSLSTTFSNGIVSYIALVSLVELDVPVFRVRNV